MDKQKRKRYNPDWAAVSCNIRVHRAKNHCEVCGIKNLLIIKRAKDSSWRVATDDELKLIQLYKNLLHWKEHKILKTLLLKRVVLSVAHLDHNEKNDQPSNLLCKCQWCHLKYDRKDNWMRRKRHTKNATPSLFKEESFATMGYTEYIASVKSRLLNGDI